MFFFSRNFLKFKFEKLHSNYLIHNFKNIICLIKLGQLKRVPANLHRRADEIPGQRIEPSQVLHV